MRFFITLPLFALFILGCTSKAKKECKSANWVYMGQIDGELGREDRSRYYSQKCSKYKVFVSTNEYKDGHAEGLLKFCSFERGLNRSIKGLRPESACSTQAQYGDGYESGLGEVCTKRKGKEDALNGKKFSNFCIKKSDYQLGYSSGQLIFCSHQNGYRQGYEERDALDVCKGTDYYANFSNGFKEGKLEFLKKENMSLEANIKSHQKNLNYIKSSLSKKITQVQSLPKSSDSYIIQMKAQLEASIRNLKLRKDRLENQILQAEGKINLNNQKIGEQN